LRVVLAKQAEARQAVQRLFRLVQSFGVELRESFG